MSKRPEMNTGFESHRAHGVGVGAVASLEHASNGGTTVFRRAARKMLVMPIVLLVSVGFVAPASAATDWEAPFDRDNLDRSTPSNRAYLTGTFSWQWQDTSRANRDQRASFSTRLHLQGRNNSCARLLITTYVGGKWTNDGSNVEKRFPESGFYTYCQADGRGSRALSGADVQDRSIGDIGRFKSARIHVCWTRNRATPPGGDCYSFTVHPGD